MAWIKNWFSNMLPCDEPFYYDDLEYRTVENFYQAMKANSYAEARQIASMRPFAAKNYWRNQTPRKQSDAEKLEIMEYALRQKFAPGTSWHTKLMETGDEEIVEYNNWGDVFWGYDVRYNRGENHLGKILMKLRREYGEESAGKKGQSRGKNSRRADKWYEKQPDYSNDHDGYYS